jgi:predicted phosphodiesterase
MRIAVFSDIHGNSIALDAVLDDIKRQGGADAYWIVGDLAAIGPDPIGALERLSELPNATIVRGNTDRYVCSLLDPRQTHEWARHMPQAAEQYIERLAMLTWTQGALLASGWLNWMTSLNLEQRITLPNGARALLVHASPGTDDGDGIQPMMTDAQIAEALGECDANLVFVGHTHWQLDRTVGQTRVINLGSVSNQWVPDLRASYYLIEADGQGYTLRNRRVEYDNNAVVAQLQRIQHPGFGIIGAFMRGERQPPWVT